MGFKNFVPMPTRRQRTRLTLSISYTRQTDSVRVVKHRPESAREGVTELPSLVE